MKAASAAQQSTGSLGTAASGIGPRAKILPRSIPFPETKPTTIEGWTVRDVVDGVAILEGPDGDQEGYAWRYGAGSGEGGVNCALG